MVKVYLVALSVRLCVNNSTVDRIASQTVVVPDVRCATAGVGTTPIAASPYHRHHR